MVVYYVTSNELKVKLLKKVFSEYNIEVIQKKMDTPEIQSLDCKEVAEFSAKYASKLLGLPVIKNDSGLCIEALNDFPGALSRYAEDTIKAEGFIKLLEGNKNRNAYWVEVLSYATPDGEVVSFESISKGHISDSVHEGRGYDYDKIYIPEGDTRTFSRMSEEEQLHTFNIDDYVKLAEYLKNKAS